jgi:putative RecB family exonuclease
LTTVFSNSRLSSWEKCPKQFYYRYVLEIPSDTEGIEAFMGKRVHEVLERLYLFVEDGMVPSLQQVLHRYNAFWDEHYDDKRVVVARKGTPVSQYRRLGERCLEYYYQGHHPFDGDKTLGVEEKVSFDLDGRSEYPFQGFIDRIVETPDGRVEIHDYKTGKFVPAQPQLDKDRQLALYQVGVRDRFASDRPIRLVWHYLQKQKVCVSERSKEQLEALMKDTIDVIDRVRSDEEYPIRRTRLCDWCEYKDRCFEENGVR